MPRIHLAAALLGAMIASTAAAQDEQRGPLQQIGQINAAEYIRGVLANDQFDPRDRERARNYAPDFEAGQHWRSSIFDGRRSRATPGTGLTLPNFPVSGGE